MRILIIGVTGRIGKRIARELLDQGQTVIGANRRPERVAEVLPNQPLRALRLDAADRAAVIEAMRSEGRPVDVVVLATAPTRENPQRFVSDTQNVVEAANEVGVGRLVVIANRMALTAPDGRPMIVASPPHPSFAHIEALYPQQAEVVRSGCRVDWLLVSPPMELFPYGEVTDRYVVVENVLVTTDPASTDFKTTSRASMEDFAHFVAGEIVQPRFSRCLVTIGYVGGSEC